VLDAFVAAWNRGDAEAFANLYTDPHVDVNHTPPVETRAATVAALRERFARTTARLAVTSDEVIVSGDWAVQRGAITLMNDGETRRLRYIEVLRNSPPSAADTTVSGAASWPAALGRAQSADIPWDASCS
jgi:ketosteroid isomerase-like protein